jgi:glucose uptake protein GlcU
VYSLQLGTIQAVKRLAKNPILMFHLVGSTIRYIGLGGYYIFKTKYIESQYRQSSSGASFITGTTSILPMAIGIIFGGIVIKFIKPKPKTLVIYMFLVELFSNGGILIGMFMGCPPMQMDETLTVNNQ